MKRIQSKAGLLKKRVKAVQGKAKFVGIVYLLGVIALAAVSALFSLTGGTVVSTEEGFTVVKFYQELMALIKTEGGFMSVLKDPTLLMNLIILALYVVLLLVLVINVFRALSKLNWLFKRRASYVNGFNRNMYAMDDLGKCFASSFAAVFIINLLIVLLGKANGETGVTLIAYIVLGAGAAIRIVFGLIEGSVTLFTTGDKIEEEEREHGLFIYFVRNLIQLAAVAGMIFFLLGVTELGVGLKTLLTEMIVNGNFTYAINLSCIPMYVELLLWIFMMVMIKHATASTEYHRDCNHTAGMKNFAIFSFLSFLMIAALVVFPYVGIGLAEGESAALNMPLLYAGIIAFVVFLFDCICRARDKKNKESEHTEDPVPAEQAVVADAQQQVQPYFYPYGAPNAQQMPYQPVFVPIYYPMPQMQQQVQMQPMEIAQATIIPPAPAPEYLLPAPSPAVVEEENDEPKEIETLDPTKTYDVRCPRCGKELTVRDATPYHRCPVCDKVFKLRKFEAYVKKA